MRLHFTKIGIGPPIAILHGLFGSSDNWLTLGKRIGESNTLYLIDQRNHGRSDHSNHFDYELLAQDLKETLDGEGITSISLVGHSMGGKTVMRFAQLFPEMVEKLIVVDIGVKAYKSHHQSILKGLHAVRLDQIQSRNDAERLIAPYIPEFDVRQFILKNLYRKDRDTFAWRINFKVLEREMDSILGALPAEQVNCPVLFISGTKSGYIKPTDHGEILNIFPNAKFAELTVGHWVHAEDPDGFLKILMEFVTE